MTKIEKAETSTITAELHIRRQKNRFETRPKTVQVAAKYEPVRIDRLSD
jgi:hypothetical protein